MSPFNILVHSLPAFEKGLATTLLVWCAACVVGFVLGLGIGWLRYWAKRESIHVLRVFEAVPITFNAIPLIVLLVWFHYLLPSAIGISVPPVWTAILVFTLYVTISVSSIFTNSLFAIPQGEIESALALGMTSTLVARRIALPLAFRTSLPDLCFMAVEVLKLISLASIIALNELLHVTDTLIAQNYVALPSYTALAIVFLALILPIQFIARLAARRVAIRR